MPLLFTYGKDRFFHDVAQIIMQYFSVRTILEKMGKTLFFRSGNEPLILSEEQREERKRGKQFTVNLFIFAAVNFCIFADDTQFSRASSLSH